MAELNISLGSKAVKGRTQKPLPQVDLTAMVDLAFFTHHFFYAHYILIKNESFGYRKASSN